MTRLADQVVAVHDALAHAHIPHAFGGALALAFHVGEPRATRDIDCNVFVGVDDVAAVFAALPQDVARGDADGDEVRRDGQVRLFWNETPIDLFFVTHDFHRAAATHVTDVPFGSAQIPILAADDLAVFKAFFNRTRDWADIEDMLGVGSLDPHLVLGWLVDLLGSADTRVTRFATLMHHAPPREPRFAP